MDFRGVAAMMREEDRPFWTFGGPRAISEYLDAIAGGSGNPLSYLAERQRLSGVSEGSAVCHDHRLLMEVVPLAACVDQLEPKGLCFAENVMRRAIQLETSVECSPRHPDFSGLAMVEGGVVTGGGNVRATRFREHEGAFRGAQARASVPGTADGTAWAGAWATTTAGTPPRSPRRAPLLATTAAVPGAGRS